jgi:tetratricopeptide (TPR) repeat protein
MTGLPARLLRRPWAWAAVLLLIAGVGLLSTQAYAWYHLRAGRAALARYHTDEARGHLDAALRVWSDDVTTRVLAARAARRAGDYEAAQNHLNACPQFNGKQAPDVVFEWAMLKAVQGDLLDVEDRLRERARQDPESAPLVWEALAEGSTRMYRIRGAIDLLDHWLTAEPDNPRALFLRATAYRQVSTSKAAEDYRRVIELDPGNDEARWWLAVGLEEDGQFDKAVSHLERLRDRGWRNADLRPRLALALDRVGRKEEARAVLDADLADNPQHGLALRYRGKIELLADNYPEAERWLRAAVRARPNDYATRYDLVQCLRLEQKEEAAREESATAEKLKGRHERLTDLRTRQMSIHPHDPALHCEMGVLCDSLGFTDLAEKWLYSALHEDEDYRPAHAALADFYERHLGDPELIKSHREQARGATAPDPDAGTANKS